MTTASASRSKNPKNDPNAKLAFGVYPAHRYYRLRQARYMGMTEAIENYVQTQDPTRTMRLLDIGPGSGKTLMFLEKAAIADRFTFHALDNSTRRHDKIYKPQRWEFKMGDLMDGVPYPDNHFDVCICEQVLEHLAETKHAIDDMIRTLRPGGLLITGVPTFPPGIAHLRALGVYVMDAGLGRKRVHLQTFTAGHFARQVCGQRDVRLAACRGFRIVSGGPLAPLEDYQWWYRLNRKVGAWVPSLCTEVQLVVYKNDAAPAPGAHSG